MYKAQWVLTVCAKSHRYIQICRPTEPTSEFGGYWLNKMQFCPECNGQWLLTSGLGDVLYV